MLKALRKLLTSVNSVVTTMNNYEFELQFQLHLNEDPEQYLDALYEAGCNDTSIGIGHTSRIGLVFNREASSALDAVKEALKDVFSAIPHAKLHRASPYLQNISELAYEFGLTKQNMRLYTNNQATTPEEPFPIPIITGARTSYWLTIEVALWLRDYAGFDIEDEKIEILYTIQALNHANEEVCQPYPDLKQSFSQILKSNAA